MNSSNNYYKKYLKYKSKYLNQKGGVSTEILQELYNLLLIEDKSQANADNFFRIIDNPANFVDLTTTTFQNGKITILQLAIYKKKINIIAGLLEREPALINPVVINSTQEEFVDLPRYVNTDILPIIVAPRWQAGVQGPEKIFLQNPLSAFIRLIFSDTQLNNIQITEIFRKMSIYSDPNILESLINKILHSFTESFFYIDNILRLPRNSPKSVNNDNKLLDIIKILFENHDMVSIINNPLYNDNTLLDFASRFKQSSLINFLRSKGAVANTTNTNGQSPLDLLVREARDYR